jgi:hypothetical protein
MSKISAMGRVAVSYLLGEEDPGGWLADAKPPELKEAKERLALDIERGACSWGCPTSAHTTRPDGGVICRRKLERFAVLDDALRRRRVRKKKAA